jgi:hypothetical protein
MLGAVKQDSGRCIYNANETQQTDKILHET